MTDSKWALENDYIFCRFLHLLIKGVKQKSLFIINNFSLELLCGYNKDFWAASSTEEHKKARKRLRYGLFLMAPQAGLEPATS